MKTSIVLSESPLRVRKITVILLSLLVLQLLRSKDLKNYRKNVIKMCGFEQNQSKLIKSVTSCDKHLILNNLEF